MIKMVINTHALTSRIRYHRQNFYILTVHRWVKKNDVLQNGYCINHNVNKQKYQGKKWNDGIDQKTKSTKETKNIKGRKNGDNGKIGEEKKMTKLQNYKKKKKKRNEGKMVDKKPY